jgi:type I restriction enzyme, R subunit
VQEILPDGTDYGAWRHLSPIEFEDLHMEVYGWLTEDDDRRDAFLEAELRLTKAFLLVKHVAECGKKADEVLFYQRVRKQVSKITGPVVPEKKLDKAVRDLVDEHVETEGVLDIFKLAGIETPDISILDDKFLQTFKDKPYENLRLKLLLRLLEDRIRLRAPRNLAKAKSFRELLLQTLDRYHKRTIDAAAVIKAMIEIKKEMDADEARAQELGLSEEELAFYDSVHDNYATIYEEPFLRDLVHDVVQVIKKNLKVDWTEAHRDNVKAAVQAAVRRTLRKQGVKPEDFDGLVDSVMAQAVALWKDWPLAA